MGKPDAHNMELFIEIGSKKRISGNNLFLMLENINKHGSISKAASLMGVSYRYLWGLLREAEKTLGVQLVEKKAGGHSGGGSLLTSEGIDILLRYKIFKNEADSQLQRFIANTASSRQGGADSAATEGLECIILASTVEAAETGLLDVLEQAFYQDTGILVRHIAVGSGRALQIAKEGRVDVVLTHAPDLEDGFLEEGFGQRRIPVMSNHYLIVGPKGLPENFEDYMNPVETFKEIADSKFLFVSRNDLSGTHLKELEIWKAAGICPTDDWYLKESSTMGNLGVLYQAMEKKAYTIIDYATFLMADAERKMSIACYKDRQGRVYSELTNILSLILLNPSRLPHVRFKEAIRFADWIKGEKANDIISNFGTSHYGEAFFANV